MDRFSSREEPRPWDSTAWRDGHCAWMANQPQTPPAKLAGWQKKSWLAGWADADMTCSAETMSSRIAEWKMVTESTPFYAEWVIGAAVAWVAERQEGAFKNAKAFLVTSHVEPLENQPKLPG